MNVVAVSGLVNPSFTGNYLNLTSGSGLNVNLPTGASQIQFDFIQNNSTVAFVINGGWLNNNQIPTTINGVTVTHVLGVKVRNHGVALRRAVTIDSFFIIGAPFKVDNLNATLSPGLVWRLQQESHRRCGRLHVVAEELNTSVWVQAHGAANFGAAGGAGTGIRKHECSGTLDFGNAAKFVCSALPFCVG